MRIFKINNPDYFCPKCGHNKVISKSCQCSEDTCEMWVVCEKCGFDPADQYGEHVETTWGWEDWLAIYALEIWKNKVSSIKHQESRIVNPPLKYLRGVGRLNPAEIFNLRLRIVDFG